MTAYPAQGTNRYVVTLTEEEQDDLRQLRSDRAAIVSALAHLARASYHHDDEGDAMRMRAARATRALDRLCERITGAAAQPTTHHPILGSS